MARKRKARATTLEKRFLSDKDIHRGEYHERESAWDSLQKREEKRFESFKKRYLTSLHHKTTRNRIEYIERALRNWNKYRSIEEITHDTIETVMHEENEVRVRAGQKYYVKFQDSMIIAIQVGQKPIEEGTNIATAHIDSPHLVGRIKKLKQNFNLMYIPATVRGGVQPKDFFNVPMSCYLYGIALSSQGKNTVVTLSVGDSNGDPKFYFAEQSLHLGEGKEPTVEQLEAIVSNVPYPDKRGDPLKRYKLNLMLELNKKLPRGYTMTEDYLDKCEFVFVPSQKPELIGIDSSMVAAYGQDNWACAFSLLQGFLEAKKPEYTKIAIFYDKEEIGDTGRAGIKTNFFSEVVVQSLADLLRKDMGDQYKMLRNSWSMFADVIEPIHGFDPDSHDPLDSAYMGSGLVINPYSGEVGNLGGYESTPEMISTIELLFEDKGVIFQSGIMGSQSELISGSDMIHQDIFAEGINVGIPILGMHRSGELTSLIDLWNAIKGIRAFYSVEEHDVYTPIKK